jgi:hypothetical protein
MSDNISIKNLWGTFTTKDDKTTFIPELKINIPKIGNPIYSAWVSLCYEMVSSCDGSLEVQTIILLNKQTGHWKFAIPKQKVSMGAVKDANLKDCVDLITGERYLNHNFGQGYLHVGSSHSHGVISAFFSGVDDASELGFPGLHATFGGFGEGTKIQVAASVVNRGVRYSIDVHHFFDPSYINSIKPHANVYAQIVKETYNELRYYPAITNDELGIDEHDNDQPIYRKYTTQFSDLVKQQKKQKSLNTLDSNIDNLSEELFEVLTEAENYGDISEEKCTEYIEEFDTKFNALLRDTIPEVDKIAIMREFCNQMVQEIKNNIKRHEV